MKPFDKKKFPELLSFCKFLLLLWRRRKFTKSVLKKKKKKRTTVKFIMHCGGVGVGVGVGVEEGTCSEIANDGDMMFVDELVELICDVDDVNEGDINDLNDLIIVPDEMNDKKRKREEEKEEVEGEKYVEDICQWVLGLDEDKKEENISVCKKVGVDYPRKKTAVSEAKRAIAKSKYRGKDGKFLKSKGIQWLSITDVQGTD